MDSISAINSSASTSSKGTSYPEMEFLSRIMADEFSPSQDLMRCPFLRNINGPINFSSSSSPLPARGNKGPIFEGVSSFDTVFRHFHGPNGVVPLSDGSLQFSERAEPVFDQFISPAAMAAATMKLLGVDAVNGSFKKPQKGYSQVQGTKTPMLEDDDPNFVKAFRRFIVQDGVVPVSLQFNTLAAAKAATISLSSFAGPFGFDDVFKKDFYQSGIAKSYRAVSNVLPLVAKTFKPPSTINFNFNCPPPIMAPRAATVVVAKNLMPEPMIADIKHKCPPAVVAARAATAAFSNLIHQPMLTEFLLIGIMAMAVNVPLGMLRQHTRRFSPSWFAAVLPTIPFLALLCSSVLMPKTAMVFAIAASVLGQVIGSMAEVYRLEAFAAKPEASVVGGGSDPLTRNMTELAVHIVVSVFNCFFKLDVTSKKTPIH